LLLHAQRSHLQFPDPFPGADAAAPQCNLISSGVMARSKRSEATQQKLIRKVRELAKLVADELQRRVVAQKKSRALRSGPRRTKKPAAKKRRKRR